MATAIERNDTPIRSKIAIISGITTLYSEIVEN